MWFRLVFSKTFKKPTRFCENSYVCPVLFQRFLFIKIKGGLGCFSFYCVTFISKFTAPHHTNDVVHIHMYSFQPCASYLEKKTRLYLFVRMGTIIAKHQVRASAMKQQVSRLEGQREALDTLAEVEGIPQVVVGGVHKEILRNTKNHK